MIGVVIEGLRLIGAWLLIVLIAHLLHLVAGCLSVGPREVYTQVKDFYKTPVQYAIFVLSAGFIKI